MVRNNLDERRAVHDERMVEGLELALSRIIRELGHDPGSPYVREVVGRHLRAVTSGAAPDDPPLAIEAEVVSDSALPEPVAF
jgi:hypothetical protein